MSDYYYILSGKTPIPVTQAEWSKWFHDNDRRVGYDEVGDYRVSTVFLGLDHGFPKLDGDVPILFETMIFGPDDYSDLYQERYRTWYEAEKGHKSVVRRLKAGKLKLHR